MYKLEITTQIGCALMCTFCPQDKLQRAYQHPTRVMTHDTVRTTLEKFPKKYEICFSGFTEPWTNPNCTDFVELALQDNRNVSIYSTFNNMTLEDCDRLIGLIQQYRNQVKSIWLHLPDRYGNMIGWRPTETYYKVVKKMRQHCNVNLMTMGTSADVDDRVKPVGVPVNWFMHTRANNVDADRIQHQPYNEPPHYEFLVECTRSKEYANNILLPNGDVVLCCMDYGLKHKLGNVHQHSYQEIVQSPELTRLKQLNNQLGFSQDTLCKSCNDAHCRTPWNDQEVWDLVATIDPDQLGL